MPAKGLIGDNHPYNLGQLGKLGTKPAFEMMQKADLVIMIGTDYPYTDYLNKKVDAIQIDTNADRLGKRRHVTLAIQADAKKALSRLNELGDPVDSRPYLDLAVSKIGQWHSWMHDVYSKKHDGVLPSLMFHNISKSAPSDTIWSIDVRTSTAFGARFLTAKSSQMYTISAWLGTMGCVLPGAIAAKHDYPDRPVYAIAGDGATSMVMQDFATAVRYNLPMLYVVLNNKLLAFIEYEQQSAGQQNFGISLPNIDFAKVAEGLGGIGERITTDQEFEDAINKYRNPTKPVLLDVAVTDEAPLPGKIMMDEAHGYAKFGFDHVIDKKSLPELPPMREILRSFL